MLDLTEWECMIRINEEGNLKNLTSEWRYLRQGKLFGVEIDRKRADIERVISSLVRGESWTESGRWPEVPRRSSQSADSHQLTPKLWRGLQRKDGRVHYSRSTLVAFEADLSSRAVSVLTRGSRQVIIQMSTLYPILIEEIASRNRKLVIVSTMTEYIYILDLCRIAYLKSDFNLTR